jgi:tetratricopeptide (TPR) repeat protein
VNTQAYEEGKKAYQQGNWAVAAERLSASLSEGEHDGSANHLLGNALMKLGMYDEAAEAYSSALQDGSYGKRGALCCNRGRALLAAGDYQGAAASASAALEDKEYPTPYKAYMTLGNAQSHLGDVRAAGVAYRNAAIDETNPDPSNALRRLGSCFMQLGRPVDAIEAFRTALDFSTPAESQDAIYAELGDAYVAANRMPEAVDAFSQATSGSYQLTPTQRASYEAAQKAVSALTGRGPSETDDLLRAAGYGMDASGSYDPLDPLGKSGEFMPSPEDTGFFTVSEQELIDSGQKVEKKHRHRGLKVFLVILIILLILAALGGYAYYRGYGWPSQQTVTEDFLSVGPDGDIGSYLASSVSSDSRAEIESIMPDATSVTVDGVDQSMTESTVLATVTLADGGEQEYQLEMVRDGLSWKITSVELVYDSQAEGTKVTSGSTSSTSDSSSVSDEASSDTTSSTDATSTDASTATDSTDTTTSTDSTSSD